MDHGTRGAHGLRVIVEAEGGEFGDAKLFAEDALGVVRMKDPVFDAGFDPTGAIEDGGLGSFEELLRAREQGFARAEELEFVAEGFLCVGAGKFGGLEFASGEIHDGEADEGGGGILRDSGKEIVFASVEDGNVGGGAGSDDAGDLAANEFFAGARLLHLLADSDLEAGADEPGDVGVHGVIRNAAHGDRLALFAIARGESDLELARGDHGVFIEKFVEIAETEEEEGVGIARLDGVVLLH